MAFVQNSPWLDAAQYGQGLGNVLTELMFKLPLLKQQKEDEDRKFALQERQVASSEQLNQQHGRYLGAEADAYPVIAQLKQDAQRSRDESAYYLGKLREAQAGNIPHAQETKDAEAASKGAMRDALVGKFNAQTSVIPESAQAKNENLRAGTDLKKANTAQVGRLADSVIGQRQAQGQFNVGKLQLGLLNAANRDNAVKASDIVGNINSPSIDTSAAKSFGDTIHGLLSILGGGMQGQQQPQMQAPVMLPQMQAPTNAPVMPALPRLNVPTPTNKAPQTRPDGKVLVNMKDGSQAWIFPQGLSHPAVAGPAQ